MKVIVKVKQVFCDEEGIRIEEAFVSAIGLEKDFEAGPNRHEIDVKKIVATEFSDEASAMTFDLTNPIDNQTVEDILKDVSLPSSEMEEYEMYTLGAEVILLSVERKKKTKKKAA